MKKSIKWWIPVVGSIIFAGVQAILGQMEADRIDDMENRIKELENRGD